MLSSHVYAAVLFACGLLSMLAAGGAFASVSMGLGADKVHANAPEFVHGLVATISHFRDDDRNPDDNVIAAVEEKGAP